MIREVRNTIKGKVIGWFFLAALAVLLTGIISYNSYKELLTSLDSPSNPEIKLKKLGEILADITKAEAGMRAYALTRDDSFLKTYLDFVSTIDDDLDSIKIVEPTNHLINLKIDSISSLLNKNISGLNSFIELKNTISEVNFSSRALEEINNTTDSLPALRTTKTTTTTTTTLESFPQVADSTEQQKVEENNRRRRKKRVQELAKQISKLELEPKIQTETKVTTDTSFIQPDTVLGSINRILEDISLEESRYQKVLANKELDLIESNILIIDQIRSVINSLEKVELAQSIQRANRAKIIASRSTLTISIIIIVCLITGILFIYFIFRDVRIGKYYNKQLIGAKNQAEQLAEAKQEFLANMTHEIRTPLNAIIGFTEQLSGTTLLPEQKRYLNAVQTSSQHLLDTVNDILDYSKIEAGELRIEKVAFDLTEVVTDVVQALQIKAKEKGLQLELQMKPLKTRYLLGDPFRLKQILFNLVNNGIKFTDTGFVKVLCDHKETSTQVTVTIKVIDSGIGIPKDQQQEVFRDFKQADLSATRRYEGTGLGLAICKRLVELQGGTIKVDSTLNEGSEFTIKLTYQPSDLAPSVESSTTTSGDISLDNAKLLVVDDDQFNINLLETILTKWELDADFCINGKEAMQKAASKQYDLILTDIHMPEVSGVTFTKFVRSLEDSGKKNVPIIALTANVMKTDHQKYLQAGINDFLLKPYREIDLYKKITEYLPEASKPSEESTEEVQFGLDDFRKFSGGDDAALLPILETFYQNLVQNMGELEEHALTGSHKPIADLAHKMISSFGHLHSYNTVEKLRTLETMARDHASKTSLSALINEISDLSKPIFNSIAGEIDKLRAINQEIS